MIFCTSRCINRRSLCACAMHSHRVTEIFSQRSQGHGVFSLQSLGHGDFRQVTNCDPGRSRDYCVYRSDHHLKSAIFNPRRMRRRVQLRVCVCLDTFCHCARNKTMYLGSTYHNSLKVMYM